jgi:hypothetical protein
VTVEKSGTITGEGHGYPRNQGQSHGTDSSDYATGGGHGSAGKPTFYDCFLIC